MKYYGFFVIATICLINNLAAVDIAGQYIVSRLTFSMQVAKSIMVLQHSME